ncbi:hypothetical protein N7494_005370 [Penicillium frequentans]|uniref:Uncharacterized protein n=1 Tax=Penicillium frequentans TaxID=3151616 RepID=A0AAD6D0G4_9EURO|nr:hypothetical protein N7494_005370 [Penicillium glabrum]
MAFQRRYTDDVIAGCTRFMQAGWESSKLALNKSADLAIQAANWGAQNPTSAVCVAVGTTGIVLLTAPGCATAPILAGIGFQAGGIKAEIGSAAAVFHSSIGNIVSGSAIAIGQSAGAGGGGLAVFNGVVQAGGAAMTVGSAGIAWVKAKI